MVVATAFSRLAETATAFRSAYDDMRSRLSADPGLLILYHTDDHPAEAVADALDALPPGVRVHGGTTCSGVLTEAGAAFGGPVVGMMGLGAAGFCAGTALIPKGADSHAAARAAVLAALADAGRPGEIPDLVLVCSTVGGEEDHLAGIAAVVGARVPVFGMTAGDEGGTGLGGRVLMRGREAGDAVVVTVVFSTSPVSLAFHAGCVPTSHAGFAEIGDDPRLVLRIDGRPAAEVYAAWVADRTGEKLPARITAGDTALLPLGREMGRIGEFPLYVLTHVSGVRADGALRVMTDVSQGEELRLMIGVRETLQLRPSRAVEAAISVQCADVCQISGALVAFCAGLMVLLTDDLAAVQQNLKTVMRGKPFLAPFSFGEQGMLNGERSVHGNLMISALVVGG